MTGIIDGVETNMVDYYKISQDADYITTMTQLESANTTGFTWSQYHAFWINAYNFAIVRAVRSNTHPLSPRGASLSHQIMRIEAWKR